MNKALRIASQLNVGDVPSKHDQQDAVIILRQQHEALKVALKALEGSVQKLAPYGEQDWLDVKAAIKQIKRLL